MVQTFRTTVNLPKATFTLEKEDLIVAIGSCFAQHLTQQFLQAKCNVLANPAGILFNPISISHCLSFILGDGNISDQYIVQQDDLYHSLLHHGSFSHPDPEHLKHHIRLSGNRAGEAIRKARVLIITLGSALAYRHIASGIIVANCHRIPQQQFVKEEIKVEEIYRVFHSNFEMIRQINPDIHIVLTVSPVRYCRDGLIESQHSKARLLVALHRLVSDLDYCTYFPAYELVIDDLRDYRFYQEDMVHPNDVAIRYVMNHFTTQYLSSDAQDFMRKMQALYTAMHHRPLHPNHSTYQQFIAKLLAQIEIYKKHYPHISFLAEMEDLNSRLK